MWKFLMTTVAAIAIATTCARAQNGQRIQGAGIQRGCEIMHFIISEGWTGRKKDFAPSDCDAFMTEMNKDAKGATKADRQYSMFVNCAMTSTSMWNFNHGAKNDAEMMNPNSLPPQIKEGIKKACLMMIFDADEDTYYRAFQKMGKGV